MEVASIARTVDPQQHAAKRQHILNTAAVLFAEKGFEAATTAQLCARAGISSGNLYHYFRTKKQIFLAVLTQDSEDAQALAQRFSAESDPVEALLRFVGHLAAPAAEHPAVPALVLEAMLQAHRDSEVLETLMGADADEKAGMTTLLTRAAQQGSINPETDTDQAADWISTLIGALYLAAARSPDIDVEQQQAYLISTVRAFLSSGADTTAR